jgi:hypothetical protein
MADASNRASSQDALRMSPDRADWFGKRFHAWTSGDLETVLESDSCHAHVRFSDLSQVLLNDVGGRLWAA